MLFLIWLGVLVVIVVVYLWEAFSRFSRYRVKYFTPVPFLGNVGSVALQKCHTAEAVQKLYDAFPNERFTGRFELNKPLIVIRDLEIAKRVTVKDFEYFIDHRSMVDETVDPLFGRNLFSLKGQEWKDMRSTLSPAFTSSKIKAMVPFMVDVSNQMIQMLKKKIEDSGSGYIDIESKDLTTRYANDVIASCAFGVKVDSLTETDNEFYLHGKSTAHFSFRRVLVYLGYSSFPSLMKKFKIKFFDEAANNFFKDLFLNAMMERETKRIFRPDMIHLLLEAKKGNLTHEKNIEKEDTDFATVEESDVGKRIVNTSWSDLDLVSQALLFFIAGFETVSAGMCFLLHELALNPDIQEKLFQEIKQNEAKNNGIFNYNSVQNLKYLDMVISELLRLWPPAVGVDRICIKDYNLGKPNEASRKDFILRKGEAILVPIWAIHRDPNHFPNPKKFDPERFSDENRAKINPFAYMPFGLGPRNCIGSRFALCELKVMAYQTLLALEVSPNEMTRVPTMLATDAFTVSIEGGHWVRLRLRNES